MYICIYIYIYIYIYSLLILFGGVFACKYVYILQINIKSLFKFQLFIIYILYSLMIRGLLIY